MQPREKIVRLEATGLDVRIRRPGLLGQVHIRGGLPGVEGTRADEALAAVRMIEACCVEPRFSSVVPVPEGCRSVDDIDPFDLPVLFDAITEINRADGAVGPLSEAPGT